MNSTTSCIPTLYNINHIKTKLIYATKRKQKQNTRNEQNNN